MAGAEKGYNLAWDDMIRLKRLHSQVLAHAEFFTNLEVSRCIRRGVGWEEIQQEKLVDKAALQSPDTIRLLLLPAIKKRAGGKGGE